MNENEINQGLEALRAVEPQNATVDDIKDGEMLLSAMADNLGDRTWCEVSCRLASFYLEVPAGNRRENTNRASELYREVLAQTRDFDAQVTASIGLANCVAVDPEPSEADFDGALRALTALGDLIAGGERDLDPESFAVLLGAKSRLLYKRSWGDRTAALEEALQLCKHSVAVLGADPELARSAQMGRALHNLGIAHLKQRTGVRSDHVNSAILALQRALELRPASRDPVGRIRTLRALAAGYPEWTGADSISHGQLLAQAAEDEAQALIEAAEAAKAREQGWARFSSQTSALMVDFDWLESLSAGEISSYLDAVLANHKEALAAIHPDSMPIEWALWMGGIGRILAAYCLHLDRVEYLDSAFACFDAALERFDPRVNPRLWRDLQRRKGEVAHAFEGWARSQDAHTAALRVGEVLYKQTATMEGRAVELRELRGFAIFGAYAAAQRGEREAAVELAEQGCARSYADTVLASELKVASLSAEQRRRIVEARERVLELEGHLRMEGTSQVEELRGKLADYQGVQPEAIGARRLQDPDAEEEKAAETRVRLGELLKAARMDLSQALSNTGADDAGTLAEVLSAGDVLRLVEKADCPIAYLLPTMHGIKVLGVFPEGPIRTVTIQGFASAQSNGLLYGGEDVPGFLQASMYGDFEKLKASLEICVPVLETIIAPITNWLEQLGYAQASLIPMGSLRLLPLHAAAIEAEVVYRLLPSAKALTNLLAEPVQGAPGAHSLFAVAAPKRDDLPDLLFAEAEAHVAGAAFRRVGGHAEVVPSASEDVLFKAVSTASHLHIACHANFRPADPLASRICIGENADLLLSDLMLHHRDLASVQLTVLSACQTAVGDAELPDESTGFPNALLAAGVRTVVSTRWHVHDLAALLFSHRFYYELLGGKNAAESTQLASRWLRRLTADGLVAAARRMRAGLPADAVTAEDRLTQIIADYGFRGSEKPFSDWINCAAFACYGL